MSNSAMFLRTSKLFDFSVGVEASQRLAAAGLVSLKTLSRGTLGTNFNLRSKLKLVEPIGIEPMTSSLQS